MPSAAKARPHPASAVLLALAIGSAAEGSSAEVRVESDVAYLEAARSEKLDLYLPRRKPNDPPAPAVVLIHGGGWTGGDKAQAREQSTGRTLAEAGYVVASVNYRLGDQAWPGNLHDCKNAVRFLRARAAEYGVDPSRIAAMGGSAGGHLALMVAYTADRPGLEPEAPYPGVSSGVRAVIDLYGPVNLLTRQETSSEGGPTGVLKNGEAPRVLGKTRAQDPERWRLASPVSHVAAGSPPTLILHGKADTTVDYEQSRELARVLADKGVPHELVLLEGIGHTFDLTSWQKRPLPRDLRPVVLEFLERHLRGEGR